MRIEYIRKYRIREFFMKKKLLIMALIAVTSAVLLPLEGYAATPEKPTSITLLSESPQIRVRIGGQRRRGRGWNRGRSNRGWERGNRSRTVRQVYWRNGRKYVRYVRVRG